MPGDLKMSSALTWGAFANEEPELAQFGARRLTAAPEFLATVRSDGYPRVHPVTPIFTADALFLFMEPTSPKGRDLRERGRYSMHNGVADNSGSGGEFFLSGDGRAWKTERLARSQRRPRHTTRPAATCCSSSPSSRRVATATAMSRSPNANAGASTPRVSR
jgi:hypothetical protein